jgi:alkylation response protein AidB-like acyl-CoA dehydrogenase
MDLELSDEQIWLSEAVDTLLGREAEDGRLWASLVEFGALSVGGDEGLGAVELCLIARALGAHLAPVPYLGSAAVRFADQSLELEDDAVALALLEPGSSWAAAPAGTRLEAADGAAAPVGARPAVADLAVTGRKVAVEHAGAVSRLAVVAAGEDGPALAVVDAAAAGVVCVAQPAFDPTAPMYAVELVDAAVVAGPLGGEAIRRMTTIGTLLAAAEAVGAAGRMLDDACRYAAERRQFGRTIGSFQALRHLLADMYMREASSWSSVLYAAAALDEDADEASRTVAIAKAYVSRSAREVAHGAMQVFGGIAVTAEHPAHRFLRRIVVRERQFGDAAHHERTLGRALAQAAVLEPVS